MRRTCISTDRRRMTRVAAFRAHAAIRVIAIARDEAPAVAGFFDQWQPLTRDLCLLDTGSTDDTIAVATAMGVRVESARFDNFAAARNEAIDRFGGGADWIVMLDLDERLDAHTIAHAEALLHCAPYDILLAPVASVYADGTRRTFTPKAFLFRRDPALRWVFSVHEKLIGSRRQAIVRNARVDHMMALHTPERRIHAAATYGALMQREPYFTDAAYRQRMIDRWPHPRSPARRRQPDRENRLRSTRLGGHPHLRAPRIAESGGTLGARAGLRQSRGAGGRRP